MRFDHFKQIYGEKQFKAMQASKVLLVGVGGIGCEVLKNLVMTGFVNIVVIDLDTIDLSNLNRQFLFQRKHVKKSKALVGKESVLKFNPNVNIHAHHQSIFEFNLDWFKEFSLVLNALDNVAARRHVNLMCLAANIPLIESGTAGYLGQVTVHQRMTMCYDCTPKSAPKTFPVCTIRSTPSQLIHCVVWAKEYVFSRLFGPDIENEIQESETPENADELKELTRQMAELKTLKTSLGKANSPKLLFSQIFQKDITRLLALAVLWENRKPPIPLDFEELLKSKDKAPAPESIEFDQSCWSVAQCCQVFIKSMTNVSKTYLNLKTQDPSYFMTFDKDEEDILNFVTAVANLRAHIFGIEQKSRFEIKRNSH
jgi:ubiquitin-like 1-activating enzyme E1 B